MRRALTVFLWAVLPVLGLVGVVFAPFGLREVGKILGLDWGELANIGQTYDAVATFLAVPTFGGVIASLFAQNRQLRAGQEQTALLTQIELVRLGIEHPDLAGADGTLSEGFSAERKRQYMMFNLFVSKWRSSFSVGELNEDEVRLLVGRLFGRALAREWWGYAGDSYRVGVHGRRRRFYEIVQDEYARPRFSGSAQNRRPRRRNALSGPSRRLGGAGLLCLAAATAGVLSGWMAARKRSSR
jgi:hypothetical protein